MASRAVNALSVEGATALVNRAAAGRALGVVLMFLPETEEDPEAYTMVVCGMIYVRQGGFMVVMPFDETVRETVLSMSQMEDDEPAFFHGNVGVETPRNKKMGEAECYLVDFPWSWVKHFVGSSSVRSGDLQAQRALQFKKDGQLLRAGKLAAYAQADTWIASTMPDLVAQDYLTGEEAGYASEELLELAGEASPTVEEDPEVPRLQHRIRELEAMVEQNKKLQQAVPRAGATSKAPALFGGGPPPGPLSSQDWVKLNRLAGPPPRASHAEARRQKVTTGVMDADNSYVALEREVEEEGQNSALPPAFDLEALKQTADPMQQLMVSQLQQNQILLQKLIAPRHSDPMLSLLDGGSASGSGGNSGIRGCLARDAFVRSMEDLPQIAQTVEANAAKELGISQDRIDMSLMRRYVERRMPLAESRLLTYISFLLADAWSTGYGSGNIELMGAVSKMLVFVEQTCLDSGRTQLSWLLTGLQDPPFQILVSNKKRVGLQPFSRLAAPIWLSANLAYVKDLDTLESKVLAVGKAGKGTVDDVTTDPDAPVKPKKPPKTPKKAGGGKGQKGQEGSSAETT